MTFSPHLGPDLFELVDRLDDGTRPRAEVWREAGAELRKRGLLQPSYESVRRIVNTVRLLRRLAHSKAKRAIILTAEYLWSLRPRPGTVSDIWTGGVEREVERHRRRAS